MIQAQRTKATVRAEPCDPTSLERGVRQLLADKVSGNMVGIWLLLPEYLRLGVWDLLRAWTNQGTERVEPRMAMQLVNESALCTHANRPGRSLSQKGFELANGLPFAVTDKAIHYLLAAHTCEDSCQLQIALGRLRKASGHFTSKVIAADPHRIRSYSQRQMRQRKPGPQDTPQKVSQTFFLLDTETSQPVCFTLTSSAPSVSQALPPLLHMATEILRPDPGDILIVADTEHFATDLFAYVQHQTPFELLTQLPKQRRITRIVQAIDDDQFRPAWPGYATCKTDFHFADGQTDPCHLFVQRTGEPPADTERRAFLCTADRPELPDLATHYPNRWHIEEFFNFDDAIGWNRARTMNINIRFGMMSLGLIAQAAIHQLRQRLGDPYSSWTAEHIASSLLQGIDGDLRVHDDTIIVTYYNVPDAQTLNSQFANLPDRLRSEGVDPRIPWLYDLKLDFRFR